MSSPHPAPASWTPPPVLPAQLVHPDRYTDRGVATDPSKQTGKASDPSRMAIYLCLLDGMSPSTSCSSLPVLPSTYSLLPSLMYLPDKPHIHPNLLALHKHRWAVHSIPIPLDPAQDPLSTTSSPAPEWITWRFSDEEQLRRRAYLPLS
ncbi:hypothetical protein P7C73_g6283, partial [Tremellales sp. Uapishka_1]